MRSQLFKTLIAVAVASTLTACASGNRDTSADTASVDTSMTGSATMDQVGTANVPVDSTAGAVADSSQVDATASTQMGASTSGQTGTAGQQYPASGHAPAAATGATQAGATESSQWSGSQGAQTTASGTMQDSSAQASTMSGQAGMDGQISAAGAMKTEVVEGTQMGASGAGMTASGMDQQAVCGMYAQLKSARSTEEREKVMTQMLLNVPRGDSALVDVREQCASAAP